MPFARRFSRPMILAVAALSVGCRDVTQTETSSVAPGAAVTRPQFVAIDTQSVGCGAGCLLIPGPVPGSHSETRGVGPDSVNGELIIAWPDSFPELTWAEMTVSGTIGRRYTYTMVPSFNNLAGVGLQPLDADGMYVGSFCYGYFQTDFRKWGYRTDPLMACSKSVNNWSELAPKKWTRT